jgi:hypothetical protein
MAVGIFTILAGLLALAGAYLYFFGVSPETKRKMENQALKTMGENKMSYMAKGESARHPAQLSASNEHPLTHSRLDQQHPRLRPAERQRPEEGHLEPHGRRHAEPHWGTSW